MCMWDFIDHVSGNERGGFDFAKSLGGENTPTFWSALPTSITKEAENKDMSFSITNVMINGSNKRVEQLRG